MVFVGLTAIMFLTASPTESLTLREDNTGWCCSVAVVLGNDLNLTVLEDTNTGVAGSQIYTNN